MASTEGVAVRKASAGAGNRAGEALRQAKARAVEVAPGAAEVAPEAVEVEPEVVGAADSEIRCWLVAP